MAKKKPAWKTKGKEWMEDHDDAHFSDNPAVKKVRKKIEALPKGHPAVKSGTRKKVAQKKSSIRK